MAAISYDSRAVLRNFAERRHITYPLLSDVDSRIIRGWGLLNETVEANSPVYGIPYPGTYVISASGKIVAKYFEDDYKERMPVFEILRGMGTAPGVPHAIHETRHLKLASSASTTVVHPNQRVTLSVDIALNPKMHVYAPGVEGYFAIDWNTQQTPAARFEAVQYPAARKLHLAAINETVPAYLDSFRLAEDIVISTEPNVKPLLNEKGELMLHGTLRYQACDDRVCYIPATVPLQWTFRFEPLDRVRAPAELQRKAKR